MTDRYLKIKLTGAEYDRLNERAVQHGKTVENYIRRIALLEEKPLGPEYQPKKEKADDKPGKREVARPGRSERASGRSK